MSDFKLQAITVLQAAPGFQVSLWELDSFFKSLLKIIGFA